MGYFICGVSRNSEWGFSLLTCTSAAGSGNSATADWKQRGSASKARQQCLIGGGNIWERWSGEAELSAQRGKADLQPWVQPRSDGGRLHWGAQRAGMDGWAQAARWGCPRAHAHCRQMVCSWHTAWGWSLTADSLTITIPRAANCQPWRHLRGQRPEAVTQWWENRLHSANELWADLGILCFYSVISYHLFFR